MFNKQTLDECQNLEEQWRKEYAKLYGEREIKATTYSGIPLKPVYTPVDIADIDYKEIGVPGEYPYTRGTYPLQYQFNPWTSQHGFGYALPEQTRGR